MDLDTDRAIQDIMNGSEFSDVTVITIAYAFFFFFFFRFVKVFLFSHRLNTILKSDRIIVMDSGKASFFHSFIFTLVIFFRLLNLTIRPTCLRIIHQFSILLFKKLD